MPDIRSLDLEATNKALHVATVAMPGNAQAHRVTCNAAGRLMTVAGAAITPGSGEIFLADSFAAGARFALFKFSFTEDTTVGGELWAKGAFVTVNYSTLSNLRTMFTTTDPAPSDTAVAITAYSARQLVSPQSPMALFDLRAVDTDILNAAVGFIPSEGLGTTNRPVHVDIGVW
jgi:hypothetical protein